MIWRRFSELTCCGSRDLRGMISGLSNRPGTQPGAALSSGEVAQLVEHTTENRSVDSSILSLATNFSNNLADFEKQPSPNSRRVTNGCNRESLDRISALLAFDFRTSVHVARR